MQVARPIRGAGFRSILQGWLIQGPQPTTSINLVRRIIFFEPAAQVFSFLWVGNLWIVVSKNSFQRLVTCPIENLFKTIGAFFKIVSR